MLIYSFICSILFTITLVSMVGMLIYSSIIFNRRKKKVQQDLKEFGELFGGSVYENKKEN